MLIAALGLGLAGGGFAVGVAYVSKWYPQEKQGSVLGFFGMGIVGAAVTKSVAPWIMVAAGWQVVVQIWAAVLAVTSLVFFLFAYDDPELTQKKEERSKAARLEGATGAAQERTGLALIPPTISSFSGASVALALWLPKYLIGVYGVDVKVAGMLAATFSLSASLFRAYGGILSDKHGARKIMYATFGVLMLCLFMLSYLATD